MGLFDKKASRKDDFDSPVEEISLSKVVSSAAAAASAAKPAPPLAGGTRPPPAAAASPPAAHASPGAPSSATRAAAARAPEAEELDISFGINKAIELWRKLPKDNVELVVTVIKTTLESINVKVASIVNDAGRKQGDIERRIDVLKKEIGELEVEIDQRRKEIDGLEADHAETTEVKERLMLAEKLAAKASLTPAKPPEGASAQGKPGV
jgi:hypothetical protein